METNKYLFQIKGLTDALQTPYVCSNYHPDYVKKTFPAIRNFKSGNAIFTFPDSAVKCAGAPQKIMYIAEHHFRKVK
jgi:sulfide:quinone oxidoreductase